MSRQLIIRVKSCLQQDVVYSKTDLPIPPFINSIMMVVDQNLSQSPSKIVKADMNGHNSEDFVIEYNRQIHCVVIDYVTEVVYWTESSRLHGSRIEMKSMDGSQKRVGSNLLFKVTF